MSDSAAQAPPVPPPTPPSATVSVRVQWPTRVFVSGVEGVADITSEPTSIPVSSLQAVQTAAMKAGVNLIEEKS